MTRFLLVRHGQTVWNELHRIQGLTDIPLNAQGLHQAQRIGARLQAEKIDHIYSSHLLRAWQTAQAIAQHHTGAPIEKLTDLAEFGMGPVEGMTLDDAYARYTPDFWDDEDLRRKLGMELRSTYLARFVEQIKIWQQRHTDQTVLIAGHGGKLKTLIDAFQLSSAERDLVQKKYLSNCSLTILEAEGDQHRLTLYSCDRHLE